MPYCYGKLSSVGGKALVRLSWWVLSPLEFAIKDEKQLRLETPHFSQRSFVHLRDGLCTFVFLIQARLRLPLRYLVQYL